MKINFTKCILLNIVFIIFILSLKTIVFAQEIKLKKRTMTDVEFAKFKNLLELMRKVKTTTRLLMGMVQA